MFSLQKPILVLIVKARCLGDQVDKGNSKKNSATEGICIAELLLIVPALPTLEWNDAHYHCDDEAGDYKDDLKGNNLRSKVHLLIINILIST